MTDPFAVLGGLIFLLLGGCQVYGVLVRRHRVLGIGPYSPHAVEVMKASTLSIARDTNLWRAWQGLNFSGAINLVLLGIFGVALGLGRVGGDPWLTALPMLIGLIHAGIARAFFFRAPFLAMWFATLFFAIATIFRF